MHSKQSPSGERGHYLGGVGNWLHLEWEPWQWQPWVSSATPSRRLRKRSGEQAGKTEGRRSCPACRAGTGVGRQGPPPPWKSSHNSELLPEDQGSLPFLQESSLSLAWIHPLLRKKRFWGFLDPHVRPIFSPGWPSSLSSSKWAIQCGGSEHRLRSQTSWFQGDSATGCVVLGMLVNLSVPSLPLENEGNHSRGVPCFIMLRRYCIFYKLKVCGNSILSLIGAIFWNSIVRFVSLCHILAILRYFTFSLLSYGDLQSVFFDVTTTTCWRLRWWSAFCSNKVFLIKVRTFLVLMLLHT